MLGKISNVNSTSKYTGGKNSSPGFEKYLKQAYIENEFRKDSIIFSPAAVFLSSLQWELHEVSYPSKEKIFMDFIIQDINFQFEIDFTDFYSTTHQKIKIIKSSHGYSGEKRTMMNLSVRKENISIYSSYQPFDIDGISKLINRAADLKVDNQINLSDSFLLTNLLDGIYSETISDFRNIFLVVYSFLSKLGRFELKKGFQFSEDVESIIVEKIATVNV